MKTEWRIELGRVKLGPFATEAEVTQAYWHHCWLATSEGICPHCQNRMDQNRCCYPCNKRWTVNGTEVAWDAIFVPPPVY